MRILLNEKVDQKKNLLIKSQQSGRANSQNCDKIDIIFMVTNGIPQFL